MKYAILKFITADKIKNIREQLKMTQKEFAVFVGVSMPEVLIYSEEIRERVKSVLFEQMRKYPYLF